MSSNLNQQRSANDERMPPCVLCRTPMEPVMQMPVRVGGPNSGMVFFREWQEMDERILILDTYRCPNCRRLDFFDLDMSLPYK
ncbi:MAG TPA: hypothetical protein VJU86_12535 [Pyrinomonadaceae bacterium]|nr:hypothetical protein [Pyrinomonadaceae bacterium]